MFSITKNSCSLLPYLTLPTAQGEMDLGFTSVFEAQSPPTEKWIGYLDSAIELVHRSLWLAPSVTASQTPSQIARLVFEMLTLYGTDVVKVSLTDLDTGTEYTYTKDAGPHVDHAEEIAEETVVLIIGEEAIENVLPAIVLSSNAWDHYAKIVYEATARANEKFEWVEAALKELAQKNPWDLEQCKSNAAILLNQEVVQPAYEFVENASLKRIQDPHFTVAKSTHPDAVKRYELYRQGLLDGSLMLGAPQAEPLWTAEGLLKENVVGIYRRTDAKTEEQIFEVVSAIPDYKWVTNFHESDRPKLASRVAQGDACIGLPQATDWFTQRQLMNMGMSGLYQVVGATIAE